MKIPTIQGVIRRRLLLNYRVRPGALEKVLPGNFRPKLVDGWAIAGICLIRLEDLRPKGFPAFAGISSENSAHRVAVEWDGADGELNEGVFVPRRDTDSLLNSLAGGRIFPGVHHHSKFRIRDENGRVAIRVEADSDEPLVEVEAEEGGDFLQNQFSSRWRSPRNSSRRAAWAIPQDRRAAFWTGCDWWCRSGR